jgi:hypothetical protein
MVGLWIEKQILKEEKKKKKKEYVLEWFWVKVNYCVWEVLWVSKVWSHLYIRKSQNKLSFKILITLIHEKKSK